MSKETAPIAAKRTLIIPDVHEQLDVLRSLEPKMEAADRVVMLGDFFDKFGTSAQQQEVAEWVRDHLDQYDILWGNHDVHYASPSGNYVCSGFDYHTLHATRVVLQPEDWRKFKPYTRVGRFLVSHAGFHPSTLKFSQPADAQLAVDNLLAGKSHPFWEAGKARGGWQPKGGPTWLDWNAEFVPIDGVPQIVGHTMGPHVRTKTDAEGRLSYCIDTGLRHVLWVNEETNEVTIERVEREE